MTISDIHKNPRLVLALRILTALLFLFVLYESLIPAIEHPKVTHFDKVMHAVVYCILAVFSWAGWPHLRKLLLFFICISYGALIEVVQGAMQMGRTGSFWDGMANGFGAALGLLLITATGLMWKRHKP